MSEHISPEEFDRLFPGASLSTREANRQAWETVRRVQRILGEPQQYHPLLDGPAEPIGLAMRPPKAKRIRQDSKPLLNKTELRCLEYLKRKYLGATIRSQAKKFRLANGCWFQPDFTVIASPEIACECKGPHAFEDSLIKLKVAATTFPEVEWILLWEEGANNWQEQKVLP